MDITPTTRRSAVSLCGSGDTIYDLGRILESEADFAVQSYRTVAEALVESPVGAALIIDSDLLMQLRDDALTGPDGGETPLVLALLPSIEPPSIDLLRMLRAGACGFLHAGCASETVRRALASTCGGALWVSRRVVADLYDELCRPADDDCFTRREVNILRRIAAGQSNQRIADELSISRDTVRWHLRCAYAKLGVHDRLQASKMFLERLKTR